MTTRTRRRQPTAQSGRVVRFVITNEDYGRLCRAFARRLKSGAQANLEMMTYGSWAQVDLNDARAPLNSPSFFVSRVNDIPNRLPAKARVTTRAKHLLFAEGLPVEAIASRLPSLGIRDAHRLHIARECEPDRISGIMSRLVKGNLLADHRQTIVDAWVDNQSLVILSPAFDRLAVPLAKLEPSLGSNPDDISAFEIDEDGIFLYWKHADAHFGWKQLVCLVDPTATIAARQKTQRFNERYGAAIRAVREMANLKQSDVSGVTQRHLRRVEHGQVPATRALLQLLANAHGLKLEAFLATVADRVGKT